MSLEPNQSELHNSWFIEKVCLKSRVKILVHFSHNSSFRCLIVHLKHKSCALWHLPFCYIGSWQSQSSFTFILFKIISRVFLKKKKNTSSSFHGRNFGTVLWEYITSFIFERLWHLDQMFIYPSLKCYSIICLNDLILRVWKLNLCHVIVTLDVFTALKGILYIFVLEGFLIMR